MQAGQFYLDLIDGFSKKGINTDFHPVGQDIGQK